MPQNIQITEFLWFKSLYFCDSWRFYAVSKWLVFTICQSFCLQKFLISWQYILDGQEGKTCTVFKKSCRIFHNRYTQVTRSSVNRSSALLKSATTVHVCSQICRIADIRWQSTRNWNIKMFLWTDITSMTE